jgi:prophage regulatory protein
MIRGVGIVRVLDHAALKAKGVNYSKAHLARLERAGKFPRHFNIGENRTVWLESEVDDWLAARVAERDAPNAAAPARRRGWQCQENPKPPRRRKDGQPAASSSSSPNES